MILSNVNIGTGPSAGDGDTLRSAFSTINNNFQIVTNNVASLTNSVTSVAGRTGNIVLTVNDVIGAASVVLVNSLAGNNRVISVAGRTGNVVLDVTDVANAASTTYVTNAISNVSVATLDNGVYTIALDATGYLVLNTDVDVFGAPVNGGANDKIRLYDFANVSSTNYAIGLENGYLWNNVDAAGGFKWYSGTTETLRLESGGNVQLLPGAAITSSGAIKVSANGRTWTFNADGSLSGPDGGTYRFGNPPPSSQGESGNMMGEIAFDSNYIYYCTGPFDGSTDIWRRVALDQTPW